MSDQAAADFAALVGAEEQQSNANTKSSNEAANTEAFESDRSAANQRVEERGRDGGTGSDDGSQDAGDGDRGSGDNQSGDAGEGQNEKTFSLGDTILRGMSRGADVAATAGAQAGRDATLDGVVQQIADRILVSEPNSGQREVRIILKDSVLPGTEVRLTQHAGKLQIQFVSESQKSLDLLNQNQTVLQQRLNEKLTKHDVTVQVEMDGQGQPDQDGRSRERQEITDEDDD
ncbi:MAG: type III secretion HpaP family protein [Planctomycetota bacterium]